MKRKNKFNAKRAYRCGKECAACGTTFGRPDNYSAAQWEGRRYCSHSCADQGRRRDAEARFLEKVDCSGGPLACWPWLASTDGDGYGFFYAGALGRNRMERAHRVAFFLQTGEWPEVVMHSCDNPPCCNPKHLSAGDRAENTRDMDRKGRRRSARGAANNHNKLTPEQVIEIRARRAGGEQLKTIAADYGICYGQVHSIDKRKSWAWL